MIVELSRRIGEILGRHVVRMTERRAIIDAAEKADSWDELPPQIRGLLAEISRRPGPGETA
jgi:hypothetical protein